MSYNTYTTKAIVCGSSDSNSADRSYLLFTKELGMLFANARSVREERSRQRYALQDFSLIKVSLVKGKSGWRIGSVESLQNTFMNTDRRRVRGSIAVFVKLLRRYVQGESALVTLFTDTEESMQMALELPDELLDTLEQVYHIRMLYELGYIEKIESLKTVLEPVSIYEASANCTEGQLEIIQTKINTASQASHL